jgi:aldose 1-epimerase
LRPFGVTASGARVDVATLRNANGVEAEIISYGAALIGCRTPDREGRLADISLGFDTLDGYANHSAYFGAVVGRYANRIARARFAIDQRQFALAANEGLHHLHGGHRGFDKRLWKMRPLDDPGRCGVVLERSSPDGEEGYPGTLDVCVTYALSNCDELSIEYDATTDAATPVNLTNHTYFNLHGDGIGDVCSHVLTLRASAYTPVTEALIPTGITAAVEGTPFDFRGGAAIGHRIHEADPQLRHGGGYDHNFVLHDADGSLRTVAMVHEPSSGRTMAVATTEPGLQVYSGNQLNGTLVGRGGVRYGPRSGLCLEPQHFPDSPNQPAFPSAILGPGQRYWSKTVYRFGSTDSVSGAAAGAGGPLTTP